MEHFLSNLSDLIAQNGATVVGVIVAFFMALFRTAQLHGKSDWLEALMCALFALGINGILSWLDLPHGISVFASGFIGFIGTIKFSSYIKDKIGMK
ncbi:phage holin, lambda family [Acinetobacter sp. ANC 4635]|uniref:phage holin, lambda family n=1 Tax=Acinetobacter sp. ANC 4635 TaxID=2529846 RepID=UPI0013F16AC7|nr:phage holin, lambda family [Acinetobacter sp. ANC 4635]